MTCKPRLEELLSVLCYEEEIIDIESVKQKIQPQLTNVLKEYMVIMDCTSATDFRINDDHKIVLIKCVREKLGKAKELRVGDIILEVDGQEPINKSHISSALIQVKIKNL